MALNLKEVFAPAAIAAYWTNDPTNAMPFASDALFPAKKKAGLDLKWLRGHKGVGVSLMPSAFDAKATFRTREASSSMKLRCRSSVRATIWARKTVRKSCVFWTAMTPMPVM
jgi:hypothetical protein